MAIPARCARCSGFVIPEQMRDLGLHAVAWRCLLCGDIVDGVILRNRIGLFSADLFDDEETVPTDESLLQTDELEIG